MVDDGVVRAESGVNPSAHPSPMPAVAGEGVTVKCECEWVCVCVWGGESAVEGATWQCMGVSLDDSERHTKRSIVSFKCFHITCVHTDAIHNGRIE